MSQFVVVVLTNKVVHQPGTLPGSVQSHGVTTLLHHHYLGVSDQLACDGSSRRVADL